MIKLLNNIEGWVQNGPMGNDLMREALFTKWGHYTGDDDLRGWDEYHSSMKERGYAATGTWQGQQGWGTYGTDPYGLGEKLQEYGGDVATYGFDPTNFESIGQALAKQDFYGGLASEIDEGPQGIKSEDDTIWGKAEDITNAADQDKYRRANITHEDVGQYYDDFYTDADMEYYTNLAKTSGLTQNELGQLESTHSRWRRMENPLLQEATDEYRGGLGAIMSRLGGLQTGSAARRRKDLLGQYGKHVTDIRSKTAGERGKHADTLVGRIAKLFG